MNDDSEVVEAMTKTVMCYTCPGCDEYKEVDEICLVDDMIICECGAMFRVNITLEIKK